MQMVRLPPGKTSYSVHHILQSAMRNLFALPGRWYCMNHVGVGDLSNVDALVSIRYHHIIISRLQTLDSTRS